MYQSIHSRHCRNMLGMTREQVRPYIFHFVHGAQEDASTISFIYRKWNYTVSFENGICKSAEARKGRI